MSLLVCVGLLTMPLFRDMTHYANPALEKAQIEAPIVVSADPQECAFQFDPTGTVKFTSSCDMVRGSLAKARLSYRSELLATGQTALVRMGSDVVESYRSSDPGSPARAERFILQLAAALAKHGNEAVGANTSEINTTTVLLILVGLASIVSDKNPIHRDIDLLQFCRRNLRRVP